MKQGLKTGGGVCVLVFVVLLTGVTVAQPSAPGLGGTPEPAAPGPGLTERMYAPGKVIVKFDPDSAPARALREARTSTAALHEVALSPELEALKAKYPVTAISCVFRAFDIKDAAGNTVAVETVQEHATRVAMRLGRTAPTEREMADLPDLTTVYSLKIADDADVLEAVAAFSACAGVEYAQPAYVGEICAPPDDPYWLSNDSWHQGYDDLWGLKRMGCLDAWSHSAGSGTVVAVVDTGVDYLHEELHDNMWVNTLEDLNGNGHWDSGDINFSDDDQNGYLDDVNGCNWVTGQYMDPYGNPMDDNGHGTHVAGTIAAIGYNATGVIGVAYEARVMALKVFNSGGGLYDWDLEDVGDSIVYAVDNGADVINCSWRLAAWDWPVSNGIQYAEAMGCLVVCAAGNSTPWEPRGGHFAFPALHLLTVAVGATNYGYQGPQDERRSGFSRLGFSLDVGAPGGDNDWPGDSYGIRADILSLQADDLDPSGHDGLFIVSPGYYRMRGTSMAAPHVSGLAALLRSARPYLSPQELRQTIRMTADDLGPVGRDDQHGFGRIDAAATLNPLLSPARCELYIMNPIPDLFNPWNYYGYIDITGAARGAQFSRWKLEWSDNDGRTWSLISQGTNPMNPGVTLGRFYDNSLNDAEYLFRLTVTDTLGRDFEHRSSVMELDGWNGAHYRFPYVEFVDTAPAIADLDPYYQGPLDVVVATWDMYSTSPLPEWPGLGHIGVFSGGSPSFTSFMELDAVHSSPAVADLDGYPGNPPRIIVAAEHTPGGEEGIFCFDASGSLQWRFVYYGRDWATSPAVADVDPSSSGLEIAACATELLFLLNKYGSQLWSWYGGTWYPSAPYFFMYSCPTLSNLGDPYGGMKVIAVGYWAYSFTDPDPQGAVYVLNADGTESWHYDLPESPSKIFYSSAAVGQIDGSGLHDIVFGSENGKLYCVSGEGSLLWQFNAGAAIHTSPAIGSLCNNGLTPQIVFGADNGKVYCLNRNGSVHWQFDTRGGPIYSSPAIAPVYYGYPGVIIGSANCRLYFIDGWYGVLIRAFRGFANITGSPTVADINPSTTGLETVVGFDDGRFFLLNSAENDYCPAGAKPWPTFQHDNARTGCYDGWY